MVIPQLKERKNSGTKYCGFCNKLVSAHVPEAELAPAREEFAL